MMMVSVVWDLVVPLSCHCLGILQVVYLELMRKKSSHHVAPHRIIEMRRILADWPAVFGPPIAKFSGLTFRQIFNEKVCFSKNNEVHIKNLYTIY
jgi:hypothetical protein